MSGPVLDSMHEETHKGKYMEHIEEIYIYIYIYGIYKEYIRKINGVYSEKKEIYIYIYIYGIDKE